jgi:hypothetical protein
MSGANIPTTTTTTMNASPLSAIAGLGSIAGGFFSPTTGTTVRNADGTTTTTPGLSLADQFTNWLARQTGTTTSDANAGGALGGVGGGSNTRVLTPAERGLTSNGDGTYKNANGETVDENGNPIS